MKIDDLDEKSSHEWLKTYEEGSVFAKYKIERTNAKSVLKVNDSSQLSQMYMFFPFQLRMTVPLLVLVQ